MTLNERNHDPKAAMGRLGLTLEPLPQVGVRRDMFGQDLDGDGSVEARIGRFVNLTHPPAQGER